MPSEDLFSFAVEKPGAAPRDCAVMLCGFWCIDSVALLLLLPFIFVTVFVLTQTVFLSLKSELKETRLKVYTTKLCDVAQQHFDLKRTSPSSWTPLPDAPFSKIWENSSKNVKTFLLKDDCTNCLKKIKTNFYFSLKYIQLFEGSS